MVGNDPERVRQLGWAWRVAAGQLVGDQRRRADGNRRVGAGVVERGGGRFDQHLQLELLGDPAPDRVVTAGEVPGVVGVQALDALARSADPARRLRPARCGLPVALGGVAPVRVGEGHGIHFRLGSSHATGGFQAAHGLHLAAADQPVERRHGRAVIEMWCVADDDRRPGFVADHDIERARWLTAEQLSYGRPIDLVGDHRLKYRGALRVFSAGDGPRGARRAARRRSGSVV